jgi:WD40 repeat protein
MNDNFAVFSFTFPPSLWHVPTAECLHVMHGHKAAVNAVVMTTCGTKTISGSSDGTIKIWNTDVKSR